MTLLLKRTLTFLTNYLLVSIFYYHILKLKNKIYHYYFIIYIYLYNKILLIIKRKYKFLKTIIVPFFKSKNFLKYKFLKTIIVTFFKSKNFLK